MEFELDERTAELTREIDDFIESEIEPVEERNRAFFDHRREDVRTDWSDGTPTEEWTSLVGELRRRADDAGFYRLQLPEDLGGESTDNLTLTVLWERLARRGPGLHNTVDNALWDQVVGEFRKPLLLYEHGSDRQQDRYLSGALTGESPLAFGLTEPEHGSDATSRMETTARRDGDDWVIDGRKRFIGSMHAAEAIMLFARTSGDVGDHEGITCFLVPTDAEGIERPYFHWTMAMPTTQAEVVIDGATVPDDAILGEEGEGLHQMRGFVYPGRIRQAALAVGTAQFCIDRAVEYANQRRTWGEPLSKRQGVQFPLVDLQTEAELVRNTLYKTAWKLDRGEDGLRRHIAMVNYRANRLACDAADRAIQTLGGRGYTRHAPFEHLYRLFRRYRITEGADEIQQRIVGGHLFGFVGD